MSATLLRDVVALTVDADRVGIDLPTGAAWEDLWADARDERAVAVFAQALHEGRVRANDTQRATIVDAHEDAMRACVRLERIALDVVADLDELGIETRLLKGAATARLDYADPSWRSFGDVDLLVRSADYDSVVERLTARGGRRRSAEPRPGFDRRFGKGVCMIRADGVQVDLHRTLAAGPFGLTVESELLFASSEHVTFGGRAVAVLDREMRFLHACFHTVLGDFPPRITSLRDVAQLASSARLDMDRVRSIARRWRAGVVVASAIATTWATLRLRRTPAIEWAFAYAPSRFERQALAAYLGSGRSYARQMVAAIPAIRGVVPKLTYTTALVFADGHYVAGRDGGYVRRLRRAPPSAASARVAPMSDPYDMEPPITARPDFRVPDALPLSHEEELSRPRGSGWPRNLINAGWVACDGLMVVFGLATSTFELIDAIPLVPLLAFAAHRMARRIGEIDDDPLVAQIVFAAFWAKMLGSLTRAAVVAWSYNNVSDATSYHQFGKALAPAFRSLDFSTAGPWSGTDFMKNLTGIVYAFTGASKVSGAIVMSFLSFLGAVLLWRAFKLAVPTGAVRRYGLLVMFLPSMLYWPSSLGKEGWAIFCLGLGSYGVARVLTGKVGSGAAMVAGGLWGVTMLRPHVAITMFCGIALAGLVGKPRGDVAKSSLLRIILFAVLLAVGGYLSTSTASFFGVPSLNAETVDQQLASAEGRTQEAGSRFTPFSMTNPANTPLAIVTVVYRPFPIEASSAVAFVSSMEGVFLLWLTWKARSRLRGLFKSMRRTPYVAYSLGVMLTLVYAFSAFSNFGILSRQRTQVLPFFLVLLCIPEWRRDNVIPTEEAVAARDDSVPPAFDVAPVDPYRETGSAHDPYAGRDPNPDPYRH